MNLLRAMKLLMVLAVAGFAAMSPAQAQVWDIRLVQQDVEKSHPICGGFYQGKWQPSCPNFARYEGPSSGAKVAPQSPPGYKKAELDLIMKGWYACPEGFERTLNTPYDAPNACNKFGKLQAMQGGIYRKAEFVSRLCKEGSFFDPIGGGQCWSCPPGYHRSLAPVTEWNACAKTLPLDFSFAKQERQLGVLASATDCKSSEFAGEVNGKPYCWSCPAGFERNVFEPVYGSKACQSAPRRAELLGNAQCQPGERRTLEIQGKQDVDAGGGCWRCPKGGQWTEADIQGDQACMMANIEYKPGIRVGNMDCPAGQEFDMLTVNQQTLDQRLRNQGTGTFLANPQARAGTGSAGSCWTCPTGTKREMLNHVLEGMACVGASIQWYTAPYKEPGLFAIPGAEEAAAFIVANRKDLIEEAIVEIAKATNEPADSVRKEAWNQIANDPGRSEVLKSVLFSVMMASLDAAANPSAQAPNGPVPDMRPLLNGFAEYIRARRSYIAQDALDAYQAWEAAMLHKHGQSAFTGAFAAIPPDFLELGMAAFLTNTAVAAGVGTTYAIGVTNAKVMAKIFPYRETLYRGATRVYGDAAAEALNGVSKEVLKQANKQAQQTFSAITKPTRAMQKIIAAAGPQIFIGLAVEITMAVIEGYVEAGDKLAKLRAGVADARQMPDLLRLYRSEGGIGQMQTFWATGTSVFSAPKNAQPFRAVAVDTSNLPSNFKAPQIGQLNLNMDEPAQPKTGYLLNVEDGSCLGYERKNTGAALIAVDCKTAPQWIVGEQNSRIRLVINTPTCMDLVGPTPAVGSPTRLWACNPNAFQAWTLGSDGSMRSAGGLCARPEASRLGAPVRVGPCERNAKWTLTATVPQVTPKNDPTIYLNPPGAPQVAAAAGTPAPAPTRTAPGTTRPASVPAWQMMPGTATDIGMGGGTLWAVGTQAAPGGFAVLRWDGQGWVGTGGGAVRIDVDPTGNAFVANDKGEMYRYANNAWEKLPGLATDVGIGANGAAWCIGANKVAGGFSIHRWQNNNWASVPGGAVRIDVDPQGNAWVVNDAGDVFRFDGGRFVAAPGVKARDIGIGADGSVFVLATDGSAHKWSGNAWGRRDIALDAITVSEKGVPFGVNASKQIWMGYP